jgi:hypothetical protein
MSKNFLNMFGAAFHAERVSEPGCSEKKICYPGAIIDALVEGIGIEFFPDNGESWFATFASGDMSPNAASFAGTHPNKSHAVIVSKGEGYVVNVSNPADWEELSIRPIMGVAVGKSAEVIVLWDFIRMLCLDETGVRWKTPSISWDGIKDVSVLDDCVQATIWDAPTSKNVIAKIAIADGSLLGGASSPELLGIET